MRRKENGVRGVNGYEAIPKLRRDNKYGYHRAEYLQSAGDELNKTGEGKRERGGGKWEMREKRCKRE